MLQKINIEDCLSISANDILIDVRSPSEYKQGHIINSLNIPLFDDEERKIVGTLYKRSGKSAAIRKGFEILGSKYSLLLQKINKLSLEKEVIVYCWRGGMRSSSMAWLIKKQGFKVHQLNKGYKSYRSSIHQFFSNSFRFIVIGGMTGTGKTEILKELEKSGHQVIDLEALANHKGSAYGSLGEKKQPTTEQFENLLYTSLSRLDINKPVFLENESQSIGRVFIPRNFYSQMQASRMINLQIPLENRIGRLVKDYSGYSDSELEECTEKIRKRIGGQNYNAAINSIHTGNYSEVVRITLAYYDKTYSYGLKKRNPDKILDLKSISGSAKDNAVLIEKLLINDLKD